MQGFYIYEGPISTTLKDGRGSTGAQRQKSSAEPRNFLSQHWTTCHLLCENPFTHSPPAPSRTLLRDPHRPLPARRAPAARQQSTEAATASAEAPATAT